MQDVVRGEVVHDLRSPRATPESFKPTNGNGFVFLFFRHEGVSLFSVSLIALLAGTNASSAPVLVVKSLKSLNLRFGNKDRSGGVQRSVMWKPTWTSARSTRGH